MSACARSREDASPLSSNSLSSLDFTGMKLNARFEVSNQLHAHSCVQRCCSAMIVSLRKAHEAFIHKLFLMFEEKQTINIH
jgi:hypothetical protein